MMYRRVFLYGCVVAALATPLVAEAQPAGKVSGIGFVSHPLPVSPEPPTLRAFRPGLRELGYIEGKNVIVEARSSEGREDR